jgi:tetratricopeptide (TPR) repeat protein
MGPAVDTTGAARFKALRSDMRARYVLETRSFAELATSRDFATSSELFAIGVSALRQGVANTPGMVSAELVRRAGGPGGRQLDVAVMEKELAALMALSAGRPEEAVARLSEATALEGELPPPMGPPRPIKPASELFGETLLEMSRPREAVAQFESGLKRWPNRSPALLGLARAYARLGDRAAARRQYDRFLANWAHADPGLPELAEARGF